MPATATETRRFVVIATPRTGSTLLVRSLDLSPDIFCAGEIFHAGPGIHHPEYQYPYRLLGSELLVRLRDRYFPSNHVQSHLSTFYGSAGKRVTAVGFKLMIDQADAHRAILPYLSDTGVVRFFLYRDDVFATALSYYKARISGVYHSDRIHRLQGEPEAVADESEFETVVGTCRKDKQRLLALHAAYDGQLLTYEEMMGSWDQVIARIGNAVGLPQLSVERSLKKLGTGGPAVRLLNEADLRRRFVE